MNGIAAGLALLRSHPIAFVVLVIVAVVIAHLATRERK
jgi:hypothetical protein